MKRKDCRSTIRFILIALTATLCSESARPAAAESVRIWPTAVVLGNQVLLGDVCELSLFDRAEREAIASTVVAAAPPPGGSTHIDAAQVQSALRHAKVNLATVVLSGAMRCALTRPRDALGYDATTTPSETETLGTLREAVREAFLKRAHAYGGHIELQFGRTSPQILRLSEPEYRFEVHIPGGRWLGKMIDVSVNVVSDDAQSRTVHLVVNATLTRRVVVTRRAVNLNATIRPEDVVLADRTYHDTERIGVLNTAAVVGQRAKRFLRAGRSIRMSDLETVPLVKRGQLVDVISVAHGIEVRTVAKAATAGGLGDTVELRIGAGRGERLMGIVIGEHRATMGGGMPATTIDGVAVAWREHRAP